MNKTFASMSSFLLFGAIFCAGCAQPPLVHTREELVKNIGNKVSVEGIYQVGELGEAVKAADLEVALDLPQDILGFGRPPLTTGTTVRASGIVERGAMSFGVFIDEATLSVSRGRAEHPLLPGFVLREARVSELKTPATQPVPQGSK